MVKKTLSYEYVGFRCYRGFIDAVHRLNIEARIRSAAAAVFRVKLFRTRLARVSTRSSKE